MLLIRSPPNSLLSFNIDDEEDKDTSPADLPTGDGEDRIVAALAYLERSTEAGGEAPWKTSPSRQEARLREWADSLGLLLDPAAILGQLQRGGMEHDIIPGEQRFLKVTRLGVFGYTPGLELALVSSSEEARRFHLWEALPHQYLERLHLQNTALTPGVEYPRGDRLSAQWRPLHRHFPATAGNSPCQHRRDRSLVHWQGLHQGHDPVHGEHHRHPIPTPTPTPTPTLTLTLTLKP